MYKYLDTFLRLGWTRPGEAAPDQRLLRRLSSAAFLLALPRQARLSYDKSMPNIKLSLRVDGCIAVAENTAR